MRSSIWWITEFSNESPRFRWWIRCGGSQRPSNGASLGQEGDRVLEVNGTQGSSIEMAKILRQAPFIKTLRGSFISGEETAKMAALFDRSALIFWMPIFNTYVKYIVKYC